MIYSPISLHVKGLYLSLKGYKADSAISIIRDKNVANCQYMGYIVIRRQKYGANEKYYIKVIEISNYIDYVFNKIVVERGRKLYAFSFQYFISMHQFHLSCENLMWGQLNLHGDREIRFQGRHYTQFYNNFVEIKNCKASKIAKVTHYRSSFHPMFRKKRERNSYQCVLVSPL